MLLYFSTKIENISNIKQIQRKRQLRSSHAAEQAVERQCGVARSRQINPGGLGNLAAQANRTQTQAVMRFVKQEVDEKWRQQR